MTCATFTLKIRVGRITEKIIRIGLDYLSKIGQDWIRIGIYFLIIWIGLDYYKNNPDYFWIIFGLFFTLSAHGHIQTL